MFLAEPLVQVYPKARRLYYTLLLCSLLKPWFHLVYILHLDLLVCDLETMIRKRDFDSYCYGKEEYLETIFTIST